VYDKLYEEFRAEISEIDTKLAMLQEAEDNYYITAKHILDLANRAHELFISSEVEERRQLLKLVLSNLRVEGENVCYDAVKPFDSILVSANSQLWLPRLDSNQQPFA
jgi:site-specific DNA recombinase